MLRTARASQAPGDPEIDAVAQMQGHG
jgi:hypothetical protein